MSNGLHLDEKEFMSLPQKRKMGLLYKNQVETLTLIKSYKFHQKIQYSGMGLMAAGIIFILKHLIK